MGATLHRGALASHCRGLSCCGAQAPDAQAQLLWLTGLVAPRHVGSSRTRAQTRVPCIGRQILNHCATREARCGLLKANKAPSLLDQDSETKIPLAFRGTARVNRVREAISWAGMECAWYNPKRSMTLMRIKRQYFYLVCGRCLNN